MFGKSRIGDSVADEMDRILGDSEFQSVFSKPELTDDFRQALAQDSGYKAFVRVASKKDDDDEEVGKDDKKKKSKSRPPWLDDKKDDEDKKKDKEEKKKEAALALDYIVENLSKTSEVLDNLGFEKSATVALALINGIYREAQYCEAQYADDDASGRVAELSAKQPGDLVFGEEPEGEEEPSVVSGPEDQEIPEDPAAPETPEEEVPDAEPEGPFGNPFAADDKDADECGSMMASASDKKKDCAAEAKKLMKKHGCKGTAKVTDKGVEVTCKGEKKKCDACCKDIMAFCKKNKVTCKIDKEYTDKAEKKAYVVKNKKILEAMSELDKWLKEA